MNITLVNESTPGRLVWVGSMITLFSHSFSLSSLVPLSSLSSPFSPPSLLPLSSLFSSLFSSLSPPFSPPSLLPLSSPLSSLSPPSLLPFLLPLSSFSPPSLLPLSYLFSPSYRCTLMSQYMPVFSLLTVI